MPDPNRPPDGHYVYNKLQYESRDGTARYKDGTLIGTTLGLSQMLARLTQFARCSAATAIKTVTENAAAVLGLERTKAAMTPGRDADLVILDKDLSVHATIVAGRIVYQR
ncbi:MAG: amidohydrolase family protein, partial [Planctomycetes bacterium]|nr:amidohydrolase family protein [Planctomycetota bacterium]